MCDGGGLRLPMTDKLYCYYLDSMDRLSEFVVSFESLRATNPKYPVGCLLGVSIQDNKKLLYFLEQLKVIPLLNNKPCSEIVYDENDVASIWCCSGKLELFRFAQYKKIVYLDTDTWVVKNIDDLFSFPSVSMATHGYEPSVNGGVLVLEPSQDVINKYLMERDIGIFRKKFNYKFDQDFLGATTNVNIISSNYNSIIPNVSRCVGVNVSEVKIWHFGTATYKYEDVSWEEIISNTLHTDPVLNIIKRYLIYFKKIIEVYREKYPYMPLALPVIDFATEEIAK